MNVNTITQLEKVENDYKATIAAAMEKRDREKKDLLRQAKIEIANCLKAVKGMYGALSEDDRKSLWKETEFADLVTALGLHPKTRRKSGKNSNAPSKPRSDVSRDDVFNLIRDSGKMTVGAVNKHFEGKASKVTVRNRLNELKNDGRIDEENAGNKVFVFVKA